MTPPHARKQGARDRPRRVLFRGPPSRPLLRVRLHCTCLALFVCFGLYGRRGVVPPAGVCAACGTDAHSSVQVCGRTRAL